MTLPAIIQDRTNDGITIVDFLFAVMRNELAGFKPCHRLDAAKLLVKYDCSCKSAVEGCKSAVAERDEALNFSLDYIPEPSRTRSDSGSSEDSYFDTRLAKVIQDSTDDGRSVCRFLINVMEGELKQFKPHHRISAARELLSRGFGKQAYTSASPVTSAPPPVTSTPPPGIPAKAGTQEAGQGGSHSSLLSTHSSEESTDHTNQSNVTPYPDTGSDDEGWAAFWEKVTPILDEDDRRRAEQETDPDNPPYVSDLSVFNEAWDNSEKWFYEWKNSLDPEEYEAIVEKELAEFYTMIDRKIERRKQIAEDREQREKEEAERAKVEAAEAEAEPEEPPEPGPPTRSQHKRKLMFVLGESIYSDCDHPDCDLHEEDRSRWKGSVQYGAGPTRGGFL